MKTKLNVHFSLFTIFLTSFLPLLFLSIYDLKKEKKNDISSGHHPALPTEKKGGKQSDDRE